MKRSILMVGAAIIGFAAPAQAGDLLSGILGSATPSAQKTPSGSLGDCLCSTARSLTGTVDRTTSGANHPSGGAITAGARIRASAGATARIGNPAATSVRGMGGAALAGSVNGLKSDISGKARAKLQAGVGLAGRVRNDTAGTSVKAAGRLGFAGSVNGVKAGSRLGVGLAGTVNGPSSAGAKGQLLSVRAGGHGRSLAAIRVGSTGHRLATVKVGGPGNLTTVKSGGVGKLATVQLGNGKALASVKVGTSGNHLATAKVGGTGNGKAHASVKVGTGGNRLVNVKAGKGPVAKVRVGTIGQDPGVAAKVLVNGGASTSLAAIAAGLPGQGNQGAAPGGQGASGSPSGSAPPTQASGGSPGTEASSGSPSAGPARSGHPQGPAVIRACDNGKSSPSSKGFCHAN